MSVIADTYRPKFGLDRIAGDWRIVAPDGALLDQPYACHKAATEAMHRLQSEADKAARRGPRPCMCCGQQFESEGIHNRMCNRCRGRDEGHWMSAGNTSTGKVRRAATQG